MLLQQPLLRHSSQSTSFVLLQTDLPSVAPRNDGVSFYKAGHEDIKDAIKSHGLDVDWVFLFKDGKNTANHREDHNAVDEMVKKHV